MSPNQKFSKIFKKGFCKKELCSRKLLWKARLKFLVPLTLRFRFPKHFALGQKNSAKWKRLSSSSKQQCSSLQRTVIFIQCLYTGLNSLLGKKLTFFVCSKNRGKKKRKKKNTELKFSFVSPEGIDSVSCDWTTIQKRRKKK